MSEHERGRERNPLKRFTRTALRFPDPEGLNSAVSILEELADNSPFPVNYDIVAGSEALVISIGLYRTLKPMLRERGVAFKESKVIPMNFLPPEEQAKRRSHLWQPPKSS